MERKTFSPERLSKIRRLRKARRLFKQVPLFAFQIMQSTDVQYKYEEFLDDLRLRRIRKPKSKKFNWLQYGRHSRMEKLIFEYKYTKDVTLLIKAQKLKEHMTKPYRVRFETKDYVLNCTFPATIDINRIEALVKSARPCKTIEEVEALVKQFRGDKYGSVN